MESNCRKLVSACVQLGKPHHLHRGPLPGRCAAGRAARRGCSAARRRASAAARQPVPRVPPCPRGCSRPTPGPGGRSAAPPRPSAGREAPLRCAPSCAAPRRPLLPRKGGDGGAAAAAPQKVRSALPPPRTRPVWGFCPFLAAPSSPAPEVGTPLAQAPPAPLFGEPGGRARGAVKQNSNANTLQRRKQALCIPRDCLIQDKRNFV